MYTLQYDLHSAKTKDQLRNKVLTFQFCSRIITLFFRDKTLVIKYR